jgi:hypothetical protein
MVVKLATSLTTTLLLFTRGKIFTMYNLIQNTLGDTSFVMLNKAVIKELGLHEAVVLGFFADRWAYFEHADFYYMIHQVSNDTGLSERECRNIISKLVDKGILVKTGFRGAPPKQFYNLNKDALIKYEGAWHVE